MDLILESRAEFKAPGLDITPELLEAIGQHSGRQYGAGEVFAFECIAATNQLTDYGTHIGLTTLRNCGAAFPLGVPYLLNHEYRKGIFGYTFAGDFDLVAKLSSASVYLVKGRTPNPDSRHTTNHEIQEIQTGHRREVSVSLGGAMADLICDVCKHDIFSIECPHIPGMKEEGVLCTATFENAEPVELSGAWRGACPGAIVLKAQSQFGRVGRKAFDGWLNTARVADPTRFHSLPTPEGDRRDTPMLRGNVVTALVTAGLAGLAAAVSKADDTPESVASAIADGVKAEIATGGASHPLVMACTFHGVKDAVELGRLAKSATYAESMLAARKTFAKKEVVRAFGAENEQNKAAIAAAHTVISGATEPDMVENLITTYGAVADRTFGTTDVVAGRETAPGNLPVSSVQVQPTAESIRGEFASAGRRVAGKFNSTEAK